MAQHGSASTSSRLISAPSASHPPSPMNKDLPPYPHMTLVPSSWEPSVDVRYWSNTPHLLSHLVLVNASVSSLSTTSVAIPIPSTDMSPITDDHLLHCLLGAGKELIPLSPGSSHPAHILHYAPTPIVKGLGFLSLLPVMYWIEDGQWCFAKGTISLHPDHTMDLDHHPLSLSSLSSAGMNMATLAILSACSTMSKSKQMLWWRHASLTPPFPLLTFMLGGGTVF